MERVDQWFKGRTIYPIYLEIAPSGGCNHRCIFCAVDYLKYRPVFLDKDVLSAAVRQAGSAGVKSVMYAGEGEPLLHRDIASIIPQTKKAGLDVSVTTNGVLLKKELSEKILRYLSWVRVSLNAGTAENYCRIHRCSKEDFGRVLDNLKEAVRIKKKQGLKTTIGVQLLLIPQNIRDVLRLAKILKGIGLDYLTIKPYSQHPLSGSRLDKDFSYRDCLGLERSLGTVESKDFRIFFRNQTMMRLSSAKDYRRCFGLPFWAYIDASGDVYACSAFLGKKDFIYGNIYQESFKKIMEGARRKKIIRRVSKTLDVDACRQACRLDKINSYLWELKHPGPHVNFI